MKLEYTASQQELRREVRDWLQSHVPASPLPSFDTEEGFAAHRQWEGVLHEGRWSMVTWPEDCGGRGMGLVEWLIFEEVLSCRGAGAGQSEWHLSAGTDPHGSRQRGAEGPLSSGHGFGR